MWERTFSRSYPQNHSTHSFFTYILEQIFNNFLYFILTVLMKLHNQKTRSRVLNAIVTLSVLFTYSPFAPGMLQLSQVAHAATTITVDSTGCSNGFFPGSPVNLNSEAKGIVKITLTPDATATLTSVTVSLSGTGFTENDLAAIAVATTSGVALYRDNGSIFGKFDLTDQVISLAASPAFGSPSGTITLTPVASSVSLTAGVSNVFFVAIRTSGTISSGDQIIATVAMNGVVTSGGNGPSASFTSPNYTADTAAPTITSAQGNTGSQTVTVFFSKAIEKFGHGTLATADNPLTYVDNGGSAQTISSISHTLGQNYITVTMSAGLDATDVAASTFAAATNKIADFSGNAVGTTAVAISSPLTISTAFIPTAASGTTYTNAAPLVTLASTGGPSGALAWTTADASSAATLNTTLGLTISTTTGAVTGTVPTVIGSFSVVFQVSKGGTATTTKPFTINVAPSATGGALVPGLTSISPPGGVTSTAVSVTITGSNTHFTSSSVVETLLAPGVSGVNGVTVSSVTAPSPTSLTATFTIAANAAIGMRDLKVTSGAEVANLPGAFMVTAPVAAGLNLLFPGDSATNVGLTPNLTFATSTNAAALSYRVIVKNGSDPTDTLIPLWDYAFPSTGTGGHCSISTGQCNVNYGAGIFRVLTPPTPLSAATDYFWQVKSYATGTTSVTSSTAPLEVSAVRKLTTVSAATDTMPPGVHHEPVSFAAASTNLKLHASIFDNIATPSTTLTGTIYYCAGAGCTPSAATGSSTGAFVSSGIFSFTIPSATIGAAGTIVRYFIQASDGANIKDFKQPDGSPFQLTTSAAGGSTISGSVKDSAGACPTAIQGASVFLTGTGFSTSTNSTCGFTLLNVPFGTYKVSATRSGFNELLVEGINAGSTGVDLKLYVGTGGGFGGITDKPRVRMNGPMDGMKGIPGNDSNFKVFVVFDRAMNQTSVTTPGNMVVNDVNPSTGAKTDITTTKGSWTFYPSAPSPMVPGVPPEANLAVWTFNAGQTFGDNKTISVVITGGVTDTSGQPVSGNQPDGSYTYSFNTGMAFTGTFAGGTSFGTGAFTPPNVSSSMPPSGATGVPRNTKLVINFSNPMGADAGSYTLKGNIKLFEVVETTFVETDVSTSAIDTVTLDTLKQSATINFVTGYGTTPGSPGILKSTQRYRVKVLGGAKSGSGITMSPPGSESSVVYTSEFKSGATSDTAAPSLVGSYPDASATAIPVALGASVLSFDKDLDSATITTASVYISNGSTVVNGTVTYKSAERQIVVIPSTALSATTTYTLNVTTAVKGLNGITLATAVARTFTTGGADVTQPGVAYLNADDYNIALTFTKPMNAAKATDSLNFGTSVLNPASYSAIKFGAVGFSTTAGTAVNLSGTAVTFSYDPSSNTVNITGWGTSSASGQELAIVMSTGTKDISGNLLSATASTTRALVKSSATTKGALGPGAMSTDAFSTGGGFIPTGGGFSGTTHGYAPPVSVMPFSMIAGQTTKYMVNLPISKQLLAGGTIIFTFPSGFDVTGAKQNVFSPMRTDLNGPGSTGTPTFKCLTNVAGGKSCAGGANADDTGAAQGGLADDGVVVNNSLRSVTVYISADTSAAGKDFLNVNLDGIKNSTSPNNTTGYTVDVKTLNGTTVAESLTSMPFFIQAGGSVSLTGTVTATGNDQTGTMKVYLFSPMTGPLEATTADFNGSNSSTYSFTNLSAGLYNLFTDQSIALGTKEFTGRSTPEPIQVTSTNRTYNFTVTQSNAAGTDVTVNIVGGPASELMDIFAGSMGGGFGSFKQKSVTLDATTSTTDTVTIKLTDGQWFVGAGPQMPKGFGMGPPPQPSYVMPKPKNITVAGTACTVDGVTGSCAITFNLSNASKQIKGLVQDGSGKIIANAEVFAYSPSGGFGTRANSDTTGTFTLNVTDGIYTVGAFVPGMPPARETSVVVTSDATTYLKIAGATTAITPAAAATSFILKVAKPDFSISGKVTDGTNVIQGASVFARKTDGPGFANAITDSSGNYTLYVANGSWKVGVFLPQFGNLTEQSVVVSGASQTNINFSPADTGTYFAVSGRVYKDLSADGSYNAGEELVGAFVRISGNSTFNEAITNSTGQYTFKVPSGNGYALRAFAPGIGELGSLASFNVTADVANKDFSVGTPNTVTFVFSTSVSAFIDLFSSTGTGARVNMNNATSTSVSVPSGTYKVNIFVPGITLGSSDIVGTTGATVYSTSTGNVTVDGAEGLTITIPTLRLVTGTVTDGTTAISNAWVEITQSGTQVHTGVKAGTDGTFTLKVADSSTPYNLNAMSPGFFRGPTKLTVSGSSPAAQTLVMTAASIKITGQVLIGASGASNAYVRAEKQGGGFAGTQADTNGNYTLFVTAGVWKVFAATDGYAETGLAANPVTVATSDVTGQNITLTTLANLAAPKTKPISPASGGTIEEVISSSGFATTGTKLTIPPSAFGSDSASGDVQIKETTARRTSTALPVGGKAKEFKATNSNKNPITTFNSDVVIEMSYTPADLAATRSSTDSSINTKTEVDTLKMAYYDETATNWVTLPSSITYKDATGTVLATPAPDLSNVSSVTIAASTNHFSSFAPIVSTNPNAPATPTGFSGSASGQTAVNLSWTAVDEATSYDIYRSGSVDGTFARLGSEPTVAASSTVTYSDTGLSAGTAYFYKLTSLNSNGESTSTAALSVTTQSAPAATASGGGGATSASGASGLSSSGAAAPTATTAAKPVTPAPSVTPTPVIGAPVSATPSPTVAVSAPVIPLSAPVTMTPSQTAHVSGDVSFAKLPSVGTVVQGQPVKFDYSYKNTTKKAVKIEVVRELLNEKGEAVRRSLGRATIKPSALYRRPVVEAVTNKLPPGMYTESVKIIDPKTKQVLGSGTFSFTVVAKPKPAVKAKPAVQVKKTPQVKAKAKPAAKKAPVKS